jgi:hypothetical protein
MLPTSSFTATAAVVVVIIAVAAVFAGATAANFLPPLSHSHCHHATTTLRLSRRHADDRCPSA